MTVRKQDDDGFRIEPPTFQNRFFILPLYVEKPFTMILIRDHQNCCEGLFFYGKHSTIGAVELVEYVWLSAVDRSESWNMLLCF